MKIINNYYYISIDELERLNNGADVVLNGITYKRILPNIEKNEIDKDKLIELIRINYNKKNICNYFGITNYELNKFLMKHFETIDITKI